MSNSLIRAEEVGDVLAQLEASYFDIPFENSDYQNRAFVMAAQQTPARAYRAIGLRMFSKIQAIKEYKANQEALAIDIDEAEAALANPETNEFDRRRLRLKIMKIQDGRAWGEKLLNDALRELNCLYAEYQKFPKYTREQFEAEEARHFEASLTRQLTNTGAHQALLNMQTDLPSFDSRIAIENKG